LLLLPAEVLSDADGAAGCCGFTAAPPRVPEDFPLSVLDGADGVVELPLLLFDGVTGSGVVEPPLVLSVFDGTTGVVEPLLLSVLDGITGISGIMALLLSLVFELFPELLLSDGVEPPLLSEFEGSVGVVVSPLLSTFL
jgi:hypothetical protein